MTRELLLALVGLAGCGDLVGLGGTPTPLATVEVEVTGDLEPLRPPGTEDETPRLRVALIWGKQWQPEPFCFLPAESPEAAAVIDEGCPDNFGFVPARVAASVPVEVGVPAALELVQLPGADVMVGDVTARVAYGSLVVFDDRDGDETLALQQHHGEEPPPGPDAVLDLVYGASFLTMTRPDQRIGFREGDFDARAAFYPRSGCEEPARGFSVLGAGGFTEEEAVAAVLRGELPPEDPASCSGAPLDTAVVSVPLEAPDAVREVACEDSDGRGYPDYHEASDFVDISQRTWACAGLPRFPGEESAGDVVQLVMAGPPGDVCRGVTHFVLRGCSDDPLCEQPEFDFSGSPPDWWPCPDEASIR